MLIPCGALSEAQAAAVHVLVETYFVAAGLPAAILSWAGRPVLVMESLASQKSYVTVKLVMKPLASGKA